MRTETPPLIHLADYRPSDFLIDRVDLDVQLHPTRTRVSAVLALRPNPAGDPGAPLRLDASGRYVSVGPPCRGVSVRVVAPQSLLQPTICASAVG